MYPGTARGPPGIHDHLAVTYLCAEGHNDIRFYRRRPVPRTIVCAMCGSVGVIEPAEMKRHKRLMTPLAEWVG